MTPIVYQIIIIYGKNTISITHHFLVYGFAKMNFSQFEKFIFSNIHIKDNAFINAATDNVF